MQSHAKHAKWMEYSVRAWAEEVATRDINSANKCEAMCGVTTYTPFIFSIIAGFLILRGTHHLHLWLRFDFE